MKRTHKEIPVYRASLFTIGLLLMLLAPVANAVTKHLSIIDTSGKPLANTRINIIYPDGSSNSAMTDGKGILQYDFKQTGKYVLSDPSGNVVKIIQIAGGGVSPTIVTLTAIAGGAALLLIAAGSGGGDTATGGDQPAEPTDPVEPADPVIPGGTLAGVYNVTATIANNPGDLPVLIDTLVLRLEIIGTQLTIIQDSSNPNFPSQLAGTIAGASFTASANGTYAEAATLFQLAGSIVAAQPLSFLINIGSDGSLPDENIITYNATGTK